MKQRFLLTICILISGCNMLWAQKFEKANNEGVKIKYQIISATDNNVQVIGGERPDELIIPAIVENNGIKYRVTTIKEEAYMPSSKFVHRIRRLVLPEGLVEIGKRAFYGAFKSDGDESIYIPSTVRLIGKDAFARYGYGTIGMCRDCSLECLPLIVDIARCEAIGLSKKSVETYLAYHPRQVQSQQQIVYVQPPSLQPEQQYVKEQEQQKTPSSDVDVNLPQGAANNDNTFAIIIANENYQEEVKVDYALNDGEMFKTYCQKVLGLPEDNIHIRKDATRNNMIAELTWLKKVAEAYKGQARFIVYYAGHGIPDEKTGTSYLLPVDGKGNMLETSYSLKDFYTQLGTMPSAGVTVFMDACFSGSKRGEGMLASARGVAIKAKPQAPQGNMVVFSASQEDETAYPFKEKEHGLFTYYLLKKLKESGGNVTLGELSTYIADQVSRKSIVANGKSQTPSVQVSDALRDQWETIKF